MNKLVLGTLLLLLIPFFGMVDAASNPNLYVSAENPYFQNHFAGSMVIEVVVNDPGLSDTDESKGEPDVTINGKDLRMVQASDGKWYAYFANVDKAKMADQIAFETGVEGEGLDFGVFCDRDTTSLGPSFSDTDGIALPRNTMTGSTNGNAGFNTCTGSPSGTIINNVVRNPRSINTNPAVPTGQIGLNADAWPLIQLFSFSSDVTIRYNAAGGSQQVTLQYDDIPNISMTLDRTNYPPGSEVFVTINDMQLNQDPTARDSWTFNVGSPQATFYAAFTESGSNAANGGAGLANLVSRLSSLDFNKNGKISMSLGSVVVLEENGYQSSTASDGTTTYNQIITFVESQPNTGIFENFDFSDDSNIAVLSTAPRGQSASIEYNSKSTSIVSGLGTASVGLGQAPILAGQEIPVTVTDPDQNINSGSKDSLDVFRSSAIIPSLTIGNPITLQSAASVKIANSTDPLTGGTPIPSSVPDTNSDRLLLDTRSSSGVSNQIFEKIFFNLGVSANQLQQLLINVAVANNFGTNWVNYDFRSLQNQLGISDFSDTSISISFGLTDPTPVTLISAGDMTGAQGLIQLDDATVASIASKSGQAFLVINFDASNNSVPQGTISNESDRQPIVFDLFSFGTKNNNDVNNAVYRFELEETSTNSGVFSGSMEYVIANQLNQYDANTIRSLRTISDEIKFFVNQRLIDEEGVNIAYGDISQVGVTEQSSTKTDIRTHTGKVSLNAKTFRFGQPVTVILNDPDLNAKHDTIEIYSVIDNPASQNVDTVGTTGGGILLEVLIKDIRYKRCTINGVEYGGLAATGFSLVETGPDTGIFQGVFKMPSQICDRSGTKLISSAGGTIELKYHDFRDASGQPNIFGLGDTVSKKPLTTPTTPTPTKAIPSWIKNNAKWWSSGVVSDNEFIDAIEYLSKERVIMIKKTQTLEESKSVPPWVKNSAKWWANGLISDEDFTKGLEYLVNRGVIRI
ncbi:MAG TPA: peptidase [Candidatus Nitrosotenuis sp.]|nr:peptidase [Candidatus Nitrosotenuis sp.]